MTTTLTTDEARDFLVGHHGLRATRPGPPADAVRALLRDHRCVQLDPLDVIGTNPDLVAMARIDGLRRGDVFDHLMPGHAFEHFAKERCLLPASAFPYYRDQAVETPWWRGTERHRRVPPEVVADVLAEVAARGPVTAADLEDRGAVEPIDWSGWKGTARASTMALEILWARCEVVVCSRAGNAKRYDVPTRALPSVAHPPAAHPTVNGAAPEPFARWALRERVEAAGLLARASGPHWSMLRDARTSDLPDQLVREGVLEDVVVAGSRRAYLAPAGFRDRRYPDDDGRMRILGPLDPLLWDRKLVAHAFGFDYIWEVYKPAEKRRWGWYVCPLLHRGRLVARIEPAVASGELVTKTLWREDGVPLDEAALRSALDRHERAL